MTRAVMIVLLGGWVRARGPGPLRAHRSRGSRAEPARAQARTVRFGAVRSPRKRPENGSRRRPQTGLPMPSS